MSDDFSYTLQYQHVGIQNALRTQRNLLSTHPTPSTSQWKIVRVAWVCEGLVCVGNVLFMLLMSISFALGSQHERTFLWNMALIPKR